MVKYNCDKCGEIFSQKLQYDNHKVCKEININKIEKTVIKSIVNKKKIKIVGGLNNNQNKNKNINVLDLFCGCGGMSKGLEDAGLNIVAGLDIWDKAINSYKKNFSHLSVCEDINKLSPEIFESKYNIKRGSIDLIVGGPPCFTKGTLVLTNNGYKQIEDIDLDDRLLTHTGKFQNILNLQRKIYTGFLYKLKIKYHPNNIICTEEHPFYVREKKKVWNNKLRKYENKFDNPLWKKAKDLTMNDFYGMVINTNNIIPEFTFEKKINQFNTVKETIKLDKKEYWYMMGYFIGDGWIEETCKKNGNCKYTIKFAINNKDENEVVEKIKKVLPITDQKCDTGKCKKFGCYNFTWFNILKQFGHGKTIPEWIHDAPKEFVQEFINGYMKADGNIKNNNILKITTVSYNLAFGLQRLYLKLGHIFSINKTIRPKQTVIENRVINQKDTYDISGKLFKDRSTSSFIQDNYVWFKPQNISIKENYGEYVYNFEVETDNSYIVENTIVHNCQGFSIAGKRDKKDPRNSLFMEYVKYLNYYSPKVFIMENVMGILSMKNSSNIKVIDIIMEELSVNYNCVICKLYASDFEVPQNRRRVIIIGIHKDLNKIPTEPIPVLKKENRIPVSSIIIPKEEIDIKYYLSARALEGIRIKKEKAKKAGNGFGAQFLDMDKPSYTIPARYWKDGYDALVKYNETEVRRLTVLELKRIQSFPDDFILEGNRKDQIMQIGNAVACRFAYHLGKHVINILQ